MVQQAILTLQQDKVREHSRGNERAPFSASVRFFDWDRARMVSARDLSIGGIFLRAATPLPEGKLITLRVDLPGMGEAFTALARVVRTVQGSALRDSGMGLEFIDISSRDRQLIERYVAARTSPL